ncbi:MAG: nicotinamide riboside transporter PnuC [bacterium]|nr:nicotinamide riboside transporter PnuC [bacterium]
MEWYSIENIAFEVIGYPISYIELIGTLFGFISVFLAARANILTWPAGIINEIAFFILFFQVQLYSDMYLQVYFFVVTVYGWYYWKREKNQQKVDVCTKRWRINYLLILIAGTIISGALMSNVHILIPDAIPASYPYADAFTTAASILATILLSRKRIETWVLWIAVDIVALIIYSLKEINLVAIEYVVFLIICIFGLFGWRKKL